jgi:outer membrane protein
MGGFIGYDNLSGAAFDDSPLLETDHSFMAGVAVAWIFKKSSKTVGSHSITGDVSGL